MTLRSPSKQRVCRLHAALAQLVTGPGGGGVGGPREQDGDQQRRGDARGSAQAQLRVSQARSSRPTEGIGSPPSYQPGALQISKCRWQPEAFPELPTRPIDPPVDHPRTFAHRRAREQVGVHGVDRGRSAVDDDVVARPRLEADLLDPAAAGGEHRRAAAREQVLTLVPAPGAEPVAVGVAGAEREAVVGRAEAGLGGGDDATSSAGLRRLSSGAARGADPAPGRRGDPGAGETGGDRDREREPGSA